MATIDTIHNMLSDSLAQKFGSVSGRIQDKIKSIQREDICRELLREIFRCEDIDRFKKILFRLESISGKSGLNYGSNYDISIKWIGNRYKGKVLEIFDIKTGPITEVFNSEHVDIKIDAGRLDLMFKDAANDICHVEEQRDMKEDDLHRFAIYHFHAVRRWGKKITDVILISGKPYNGPKTIETGSGIYSPKIIDLTQRDGKKRLEQIKEEINAGNYDNVVELIFIPMYGKEDCDKVAAEVLEYEIRLLKKNKLDDDLVFATMITSNKIIDKDQLKKYYEEVKNMLDILNIAIEDGMQKGMQKGRQEGMQKGRQEGAQDKAIQMAKVLKQDGINVSAISRASGLSAQEITML